MRQATPDEVCRVCTGPAEDPDACKACPLGAPGQAFPETPPVSLTKDDARSER